MKRRSAHPARVFPKIIDVVEIKNDEAESSAKLQQRIKAQMPNWTTPDLYFAFLKDTSVNLEKTSLSTDTYSQLTMLQFGILLFGDQFTADDVINLIQLENYNTDFNRPITLNDEKKAPLKLHEFAKTHGANIRMISFLKKLAMDKSDVENVIPIYWPHGPERFIRALCLEYTSRNIGLEEAANWLDLVTKFNENPDNFSRFLNETFKAIQTHELKPEIAFELSEKPVGATTDAEGLESQISITYQELLNTGMSLDDVATVLFETFPGHEDTIITLIN